MTTTYTASALRDNLADVLAAVAKGDVIDVLSYTTPVARIVPAGYELAVLQRIADGPPIGQLQDLADLTGLNSIGALLDAHAELVRRGVDMDYPEWGDPKSPPYTLDDLVLLDSLAAAAPALLGSGHPVADWQAAIAALNELADFTSWYSSGSTALAGAAATRGYSPASLLSRVKALLAAGVAPQDVETMFGDDPVPEDLMASHGYRVREKITKLDAAGLPREDSYALLREGLDTEQIITFTKVGITAPADIIELSRNGVHPYFVPRAHAEYLPVADWPRVLGPLRATLTEGNYGKVSCPIDPRPGNYTLAELSWAGAPDPVRIAWDGIADWHMPVKTRRELAGHGIYPQLFQAIWKRLNWGGLESKTTNGWVPARDEEHVDEVCSLISAGVTHELLDRLVIGTVRTPKHLFVVAEDLVELAALAPTVTEARTLADAGAKTAHAWIYQLQLWRRFEAEAREFTGLVREVEGVGDFLDWLAGPHPKYRKPFYGPDLVRTEAVKVFAGKKVPGTRPSYLYATVLAQALHDTRMADEGHREAAKRFMHQVKLFMDGVMGVLAREREEEQAALEVLKAEVGRIEILRQVTDGAE